MGRLPEVYRPCDPAERPLDVRGVAGAGRMEVVRRRLFALLASHAIAAYACACVIVLSNLQSLSLSQLLTPSFIIPTVLAPLTILPVLAVSPWFFREFGLPAWELAVLWGAYIIPLLATYRCLAQRRNREGSCTRCGYSLIGNTSGTCPECGTAIPTPPSKESSEPA